MNEVVVVCVETNVNNEWVSGYLDVRVFQGIAEAKIWCQEDAFEDYEYMNDRDVVVPALIWEDFGYWVWTAAGKTKGEELKRYVILKFAV